MKMRDKSPQESDIHGTQTELMTDSILSGMLKKMLLFLIAFSALLATSFSQEIFLNTDFKFEAPNVKSVALAGTFNNWDITLNQMKKISGSTWSASLKLKPGYYYYHFVVDGKALPDPTNSLRMKNGLGHDVSVIKVGNPQRPKRIKHHLPFPKEKFPHPVLEKNPELVDLYYAACETAWNKIYYGTKTNRFSKKYMDDGVDNALHQWDACFTAAYATYIPDLLPALPTLDIFYSKQSEDGGIFREYSQTTGKPVIYPTADDLLLHPPLFAWIELKHYRLTGDLQRVRAVLPKLIKYFGWIERNCNLAEHYGLYSTTPSCSGMINSPRGDAGNGVWVDFSAQQALAAKSIAELAKIIRDTVAERNYTEIFMRIRNGINSLCWDDAEQFYFDLTSAGALSRVKHIGAYWTLLADVPDSLQCLLMIKHLVNPEEFWRTHLVPSLPANHPEYDPRGQYWKGSVWGPTNYMIIQGLIENGYPNLADNIAMNHLANLSNTLRAFKPDEEKIAFEERYGDEYKTIWECYSPESPEPATRWDGTFLSRQDYVGTSGIGPVAMLIENVLGLNFDGVNNKIIWNVKRVDKHGIERIKFRDQMISLGCDPREKQLWMHVTVEKPLTLEVFWNNKVYTETIDKIGTSLLILK